MDFAMVHPIESFDQLLCRVQLIFGTVIAGCNKLTPTLVFVQIFDLFRDSVFTDLIVERDPDGHSTKTARIIYWMRN